MRISFYLDDEDNFEGSGMFINSMRPRVGRCRSKPGPKGEPGIAGVVGPKGKPGLNVRDLFGFKFKLERLLGLLQRITKKYEIKSIISLMKFYIRENFLK